jgi:hypothetical protein
MCPEAHVLEDTIRHDLVVHKRAVKILKKDFGDNSNSIPLSLAKTLETKSDFILTRIQLCSVFQSANSILTLTSLSTVRLLL